MKKNLLVAHGGGPTAVINASLFGVIEAAKLYDEIDGIYGAVHGIEGVLNENIVDLRAQSDAQISLLPYTPSSALGSCRRKLTADDYPVLLDIFKKHNVGYFLYNGGNDSMDTCDKVACLAETEGLDLRVIGIPKTIDNDLGHTDHCPGYGSAARFVASNTRDLWMEVSAMPLYVTILETMGRNAGWLAAASSLARHGDEACAKFIYLPEIPFDEDLFMADIDRYLTKRKDLLIVVSEGITDMNGGSIADMGMVDGFGHTIPGGVAQTLAEKVKTRLGVKARGERPGFLGRASSLMQSVPDREEAVAIGRYAVDLALAGKTGLMVTINRVRDDPYKYKLSEVELKTVANAEKKFPREWIDGRNGIKSEFTTYCLPLIGKNLEPYAKLDLNI